ncbi:hypothetical protein NPIL_580231 [Nephila pilipes]|uniref:Uncharacterized protein n=1 Tax=Nephila pilipes TaxID=299642 RepID=A0A8X6N396_NEPPI|nr:hypothetical protein NPIL_580231 [Nephila pilipes]
MHSFPTSFGAESEINTVANSTTPVKTPANLDKNPASDTESDDNDGFTVVNRKRRKKSPIIIDETFDGRTPISERDANAFQSSIDLEDQS